MPQALLSGRSASAGAHLLVALATAAVFVLDLQTPWGVATWILYAFPTFVLCWASGTRYLVPYAGLVSALIVLDHFLSAPQAPASFSVFNRAAGLAALWTAAWLIARRERERQALQQLRDGLEQTVAERTAALRQSEEHCRQGEAQMRSLLEHSSDVIVAYDENLDVVYASPSVGRLLGYEPARMVGKPGLAIVHPDDAAQVKEVFRKVRADGNAVERCEVRTRHRDGDWRWFEMAVSACADGGVGHRFIVNSRDVTERKEAERLHVQSLERQRDALVREVHHRIKNNLQGVIGLLQRHARARPELAELMREAVARVGAVATLHGLYAGAAVGRVALCEVAQAVARYNDEVFPDVRIEFVRPADWRESWLDERDAVAVALVVNELALNAIKACLRERCGEPVRVALAREGGTVILTVSNRAGRLPEGFDFAASRALGTGLALVKSLLVPGTAVAVRQLEPQGVEAELRVAAPVIIDS